MFLKLGDFFIHLIVKNFNDKSWILQKIIHKLSYHIYFHNWYFHFIHGLLWILLSLNPSIAEDYEYHILSLVTNSVTIQNNNSEAKLPRRFSKCHGYLVCSYCNANIYSLIPSHPNCCFPSSLNIYLYIRLLWEWLSRTCIAYFYNAKCFSISCVSMFLKISL